MRSWDWLMERRTACASSLVYKGKEMTNISTERLEEMRRGLEGVTPGPWKAVSEPNYENGYVYTSVQPERPDPEALRHLLMASGEHHVCRMTHTPMERKFRHYRVDAAHIAHCDPDTIRSMIDELLAYRSLDKGEVEDEAGEVVDEKMLDRARRRASDAIHNAQADKGEVVKPSPAWVGDYRKSDGTFDYFVMLGHGESQMSLHCHKIRGRAEYEAAEINHALTGGPKPEFEDFELDASPQPAPKGVEITDRLPTRKEAAEAAAILLRCNGHDLDVWTGGDFPDEDDWLKALAAMKET